MGASGIEVYDMRKNMHKEVGIQAQSGWMKFHIK